MPCCSARGVDDGVAPQLAPVGQTDRGEPAAGRVPGKAPDMALDNRRYAGLNADPVIYGGIDLRLPFFLAGALALANLSHLPDPVVELVRASLRGRLSPAKNSCTSDITMFHCAGLVSCASSTSTWFKPASSL